MNSLFAFVAQPFGAALWSRGKRDFCAHGVYPDVSGRGIPVICTGASRAAANRRAPSHRSFPHLLTSLPPYLLTSLLRLRGGRRRATPRGNSRWSLGTRANRSAEWGALRSSRGAGQAG